MDMDRVTKIVFNVSQTTLAAEVGVDPSYLSAIRNGRRYPSVRMLGAMKDALNKRLPEGEVPITLDEITAWVDGMVGMRESVFAA